MISRSQFRVHPCHEALARQQFADALEKMRGVHLYVTVETKDQYHELRRKIAKRAAAKRKR